MKAAQILESGLAGAATLTLLSETRNKINSNSPNTNLFHRKGIVRHLKKGMRKKGFKAVKMYVSVAAELLSIAGALGISGLGKKKNAVLQGGLAGALTGTAVAFLQNVPENESDNNELWRKRLVTIALYILGGLVAGKVVQAMNKKKKKK